MSARHVAMKPSGVGVPMIVALGRLGLRTNLRLCLDAGDGASYSSGQSWLDTSGNGYDFFLGADGSATSTDPTFNGTVGRRSSGEYFSFDGGDYFTYDTTNETWMQNLHKDNAAFTIASWLYLGANGSALFGTSGGSSSNVGIEIFFNSSVQMSLEVRDGSAPSASSLAMTAAAPTSAWFFSAISVNESVGAGGTIMMVNGTAETFTSTYSSPSSSNASHTFQIGARGNASAPFANNSRMASFMAWEGRALSAGDLRALYQATRIRFGV